MMIAIIYFGIILLFVIIFAVITTKIELLLERKKIEKE